jgi:hypothetical protein
MSKIKFTAKVTQGNIEIPQEYRESIEQVETVEIIIKRHITSSHQGIIHRLINNPIDLPNFIPLTRNEVHER